MVAYWRWQNILISNAENIIISNLLGEKIIEKNISARPNQKIELDVSAMSAGIYFIKAGNAVKKFVKE